LSLTYSHFPTDVSFPLTNSICRLIRLTAPKRGSTSALMVVLTVGICLLSSL